MATNSVPLPWQSHHIAALTVLPSSSANADTRPTKKRRARESRGTAATSALPTGDSPAQQTSQARIGLFHPDITLGPGTYGTYSVDVPGRTPSSSQVPSFPSSQQLIQPTQPPSFDQVELRPGATNEGSWASSASGFLAEPQVLLGTNSTSAAGHSLCMWGHPPLTPVGQVTASSVSNHWLQWHPVTHLPLGDLEPYDQLPATAAYNPLIPLPTSPASIGHECQPYVGPALGLGGAALVAGYLGYGPGTLDPHSSSLHITHGQTEQLSFVGIPTPESVQLEAWLDPSSVSGAYHTPATLQSSLPDGHTPAVSPLSGFGLSSPYCQDEKQPDHGDRIKNEHSVMAENGGRQSVPGPPPLDNPFVLKTSKPQKSDCKTSHDRKKRTRYDECLRKETSDTRSMGACLRCHNQKVRCIPNQQDSRNPFAPCETCLMVRRDSKKTIHNIPCFRFKVTSMTIYRPGGLGLTKRFTHTKLVDVAGSKATYEIEVEQGLCRCPLRLRVRNFTPKETDRLEWTHTDEDGRQTKKKTDAYCLSDVEQTARYFAQYIENNYLDGLELATNGSDEIVQRVFETIGALCRSASVAIKTEEDDDKKDARRHQVQGDLLRKIARLWFAIRHGTGTAWLCGKGHLGSDYPLHERTIVPRMIVAQFDSIRHERIYKKLAPEVLRTVDAFLTSCNKEAWFTVFLATFLLLHQVAHTSKDRFRHAQHNSNGKQLDTRYGNLQDPLTGFVEDVHHGAVILLAHWHYFKRCDLMSFNWKDIGNSPLMYLEPDQVALVRSTVEGIKTKLSNIPATPEGGCWEHELFWVSKMFVSEPSRKAHWTPPETFTRAKPSVGRVLVRNGLVKREMDSIDVLVRATACIG